MAAGENWNGKFQFVGNGGWAGIISFPAMASALQEGYATASTDTGHKGGNALFAIGHPEKVVDFAYRAVHEIDGAGEGARSRSSTIAARAAVVLERLLDRRTSGPDGGAEVSRRTSTRSSPARRRTTRRICTHGTCRVAVPALKDPAAAVPAAKLDDAQPGGARRVRRAATASRTA